VSLPDFVNASVSRITLICRDDGLMILQLVPLSGETDGLELDITPRELDEVIDMLTRARDRYALERHAKRFR
jgi:hypothetical protein